MPDLEHDGEGIPAPEQDTPPAPTEEPRQDAGQTPDPADAVPVPDAGEDAVEADEVPLGGVGLGVGLCEELLMAVGRDSFHGGVRPDNITLRDNHVSLGGKLKHNVGEFTPQELEYMAPELFWVGLREPAADVYSVGLVLYSVYNYGRLPFWPETGAVGPNDRALALQKRMSGETIKPPAAAGEELADIILRALAFRTEERWQDAQELVDVLGECDASAGPADISLVISGLIAKGAEPAPASPTPRLANYDDGPEFMDEKEFSGKKARRHKNLTWVWVGVLLLFIVGSLFLLLRGGQGSQPAAPAESPAPSATPAVTASPEPTAEPTPEPTAVPDGPRFVAYIEDVSWTEAVARCEELGGKLAYPTTQEELDAITTVCQEAGLERTWLGASRQNDGFWKTTEGEDVTFYFWGDNEPSFTDKGDGATENYMLLWRFNGVWCGNDSREDPLTDYYAAYTGQIGFVCQMY